MSAPWISSWSTRILPPVRALEKGRVIGWFSRERCFGHRRCCRYIHRFRCSGQSERTAGCCCARRRKRASSTTRRANHFCLSEVVSSPCVKNISVFQNQKTSYICLAIPSRQEGRCPRL